MRKYWDGKKRKKKGTGEDLGRKEGRENVRKKTDNPREGWEDAARRHHTGILGRGV